MQKVEDIFCHAATPGLCRIVCCDSTLQDWNIVCASQLVVPASCLHIRSGQKQALSLLSVLTTDDRGRIEYAWLDYISSSLPPSLIRSSKSVSTSDSESSLNDPISSCLLPPSWSILPSLSPTLILRFTVDKLLSRVCSGWSI
jgi:hypothetical protein